MTRHLSLGWAVWAVGPVLAFAPGGRAADWPATVTAGSRGHEVALVQSVLNEAAETSLTVDGIYGPQTSAAVKSFQAANGLAADGTIGPGTWAKLFAGTARYVIEFARGAPPADDLATTEDDSLYECEVRTVRVDARGVRVVATHRGSVMPADMTVKGRVKNGWYPLHLGLHKRQGLTPTAADLKVKTNGTLRPCLVVNEDRAVPVESDNPAKTTSVTIHVHNGYNTGRYSEGCQTLRPSDWGPFIEHFLGEYTRLADWHTPGTYRGRPVGVLVISGP